MLDIIKQVYGRDHKSAQQVLNGGFDLKDVDGNIILPALWDSVVEPGMTISINFWPIAEAAGSTQDVLGAPAAAHRSRTLQDLAGELLVDDLDLDPDIDSELQSGPNLRGDVEPEKNSPMKKRKMKKSAMRERKRKSPSFSPTSPGLYSMSLAFSPTSPGYLPTSPAYDRSASSVSPLSSKHSSIETDLKSSSGKAKESQSYARGGKPDDPVRDEKGSPWDEAARMQLRVVETCKRTLGEQHQDTLSSMASLANIYKHQGQTLKAKELTEEIEAARKKILALKVLVDKPYDLYELPSERTQQTQAEIDATVETMRQNINKVAERGARLDSLQDKTDNLAVSAQGFRRGAARRQPPDLWGSVYKWFSPPSKPSPSGSTVMAPGASAPGGSVPGASPSGPSTGPDAHPERLLRAPEPGAVLFEEPPGSSRQYLDSTFDLFQFERTVRLAELHGTHPSPPIISPPQAQPSSTQPQPPPSQNQQSAQLPSETAQEPKLQQPRRGIMDVRERLQKPRTRPSSKPVRATPSQPRFRRATKEQLKILNAEESDGGRRGSQGDDVPDKPAAAEEEEEDEDEEADDVDEDAVVPEEVGKEEMGEAKESEADGEVDDLLREWTTILG